MRLARVLVAQSGLAVLAAAMLIPSCVHGQALPTAVVQVTVTQEGGGPLAGVSVVLAKAGVGALLMGTTNAQGRYTFAIEIDTGHFSLAARKVGYISTSRVVPIAEGGTMSLAIALAHNPANLDTVRSTAEQLTRKEYFLEAADIAASTRGIYDALDAIRKLRPDMIGDSWRTCPKVENLWVNGQRIWWGKVVFLGTRMNSSQSMRGSAGGAGSKATREYRSPAPWASPDLPLDTVLTYIHSGDIAEMRYVNCWDSSNAEIGTKDALYVTLKPGFGWSWKYGTYLADSAAAGLRSPPPRQQ
jgi:hypothetical protein